MANYVDVSWFVGGFLGFGPYNYVCIVGGGVEYICNRTHREEHRKEKANGGICG